MQKTDCMLAIVHDINGNEYSTSISKQELFHRPILDLLCIEWVYTHNKVCMTIIEAQINITWWHYNIVQMKNCTVGILFLAQTCSIVLVKAFPAKDDTVDGTTNSFASKEFRRTIAIELTLIWQMSIIHCI